jgi:hypothetical protein
MSALKGASILFSTTISVKASTTTIFRFVIDESFLVGEHQRERGSLDWRLKYKSVAGTGCSFKSVRSSPIA